MDKTIKVAVIGLDTSHAIEFPRRMQAPDCPPDQRVSGLRAVRCLTFGTPFTNDKVLTDRQKQLETWGVTVTSSFREAVGDCDAIMIEINDPAFHLEYFTRCADLGKPIFLDKPLADTLANGRKIADIAKTKGVKLFSASSLRFVPQLVRASEKVPEPRFVDVFGPLGKAPAGSSIVWYGVHAFEMLNRAMGRGARSVFVRKDPAGAVVIVQFDGNRRGTVNLTFDCWQYGGALWKSDASAPFAAEMGRAYTDLLSLIGEFFRTGVPPVAIEDTLEILAMLDAAARSNDSEREEPVGP